MNEEIRYITNKGKTDKSEWENDDSNFPRALYSVHEKIRTIPFPYLLVHLFKPGNKNMSVLLKVIIFEQVNKLSIKTMVLTFLKYDMYINAHNPFQLSITFHIENSHLIYSANQMAGFYIKCNTKLKWVNKVIKS